MDKCEQYLQKGVLFCEFCDPARWLFTGKLKRNIAGVLISDIDVDKRFDDPSKPWRDRAMNGLFHSDRL